MNHVLTKRIVALALITTLVVAAPMFGRPAMARSLSQITSSGTIRLGFADYPPFESRNVKTGKVTGLIPDALDAALEPTKLKIKWIEVTWATFAAALQSDQIDVFAAPAFATPTRALSLSFSEPYAYGGNTLVVRKTDADGRFKGFTTWEDFNRPGITVSTLLGGQTYEWAKTHFTKAKILGLPSSNPNAEMLAVLSGRANVAYNEASAAERFVAAHSGQLVDLFVNKPLNVTAYSFAVKQNSPALLAFINTTLTYMALTGIWGDLENGKYKGQLPALFHIRRSYYQAGSPASSR